MPFPSKEHFLPLCVKNTDLGNFGPGFPLLFEFIKYNAILLAVLTLIYFVPAMVMIFLAFKKVKMGEEEDDMSLFSFGAFIKEGKLVE